MHKEHRDKLNQRKFEWNHQELSVPPLMIANYSVYIAHRDSIKHVTMPLAWQLIIMNCDTTDKRFGIIRMKMKADFCLPAESKGTKNHILQLVLLQILSLNQFAVVQNFIYGTKIIHCQNTTKSSPDFCKHYRDHLKWAAGVIWREGSDTTFGIGQSSA